MKSVLFRTALSASSGGRFVKKIDSGRRSGARLALAALVGFAIAWTGTLASAAPIDLKRDLIQKITTFEIGEHREKYLLETRQAPDFPEHSRIEVHFDKGALAVRFVYDRQALAKPALMLPDVLLFSAMRNFSPIEIAGLEPKSNPLLASFGPETTMYSIAEIIQNARLGSASAQARLLRWKAAAIDGLKVSDAFESQFPGTRIAVARRLSKLKDDVGHLKSAASDVERFRIDRQKLAALVLRNDRAGVAAFLRASIPWRTLQPIERQTWETWIEATENPSPERAVWLFRGFQNQTRFDQSYLSDSGGSAFLSPRLVPELNQLDVDRSATEDPSAEIVHKITDLMTVHSEAKVAGPSIFMSFTSDFDVAEGFVSGTERFEGAPGQLLAVRIDSRRAFPNFLSQFGRELEYLAPLFVFPDEVMHLAFNYTPADRDAFMAAIAAKGYRPLPIEDVSTEFRKGGAELLKAKATVRAVTSPTCRAIFH